MQGTISFVAGATAKHGDMKVDTPVATMGIRGTAVLVEIDFEVPGQGGAPPARFQVLVEPDGTTGSYILFDKMTLTPIATVNQAGTQTIISGQGIVSFLSSAQLSPDAQKIIKDIFSLNSPTTTIPIPSSHQFHRFDRSANHLRLKTASGDIIPVTLHLVIGPDRAHDVRGYRSRRPARSHSRAAARSSPFDGLSPNVTDVDRTARRSTDFRQDQLFRRQRRRRSDGRARSFDSYIY